MADNEEQTDLTMAIEIRATRGLMPDIEAVVRASLKRIAEAMGAEVHGQIDVDGSTHQITIVDYERQAFVDDFLLDHLLDDTRTRNLMRSNNIITVRDLCERTEMELHCIPGLGGVQIARLKVMLGGLNRSLCPTRRITRREIA